MVEIDSFLIKNKNPAERDKFEGEYFKKRNKGRN